MAGGDTKQRINDLETENAILREAVKRLSGKPSLRDRLAMAALPKLHVYGDAATSTIAVAKYAYEMADAMMEVRDGK